MKLAVPALGRTTCSAVAPTFARCRFFIVIDTDCHDITVVENTGATQDNGAGTAAVQILADLGVGSVLAHRCGPQATRALAAARIDVRVGYDGTVVETIEAFTAGLPQ